MVQPNFVITCQNIPLWFLAAAFVFSLLSLCFLKNFLKLEFGTCALIGALSALAGAGVGFAEYQKFSRQIFASINPEYISNLATLRGLVVFLLIPFLIRLYLSWARPEERDPAVYKARGWLRLLDWAYALFIAFGASAAWSLSIFVVLPALALILLAHPMINRSMNPNSTPSSVPREDLSAARDRVLSLLEQGKITADESANLLAALGDSRNSGSAHRPSSAAPKTSFPLLPVLGAGLILIGFFLPWFSFNPIQELGRLTGQLPLAVPGGMVQVHPAGAPAPLQMNFGFGSMNSISVSGPELNRGLGWIILFCGLGAASVSFLLSQIPPPLQLRVSLFLLAPGSLVIVYLLSDQFRNMDIGFGLVIAGYLLTAVGCYQRRSLSSVSGSSVAPSPA